MAWKQTLIAIRRSEPSNGLLLSRETEARGGSAPRLGRSQGPGAEPPAPSQGGPGRREYLARGGLQAGCGRRIPRRRRQSRGRAAAGAGRSRAGLLRARSAPGRGCGVARR